jgi:caa(3)-type oxidase subunit IV
MRLYLAIFALLAGFTFAELAIKYLSLSRPAMIVGLMALALAKASCVALFFMHLRRESRALKLVVAVPLLLPALFALGLLGEAAARR